MSFWTSTEKTCSPNLTTEQEKIVNCDSRIILASACPGSGKSTTLAARARRLWKVYNEPILVCTFSNKAVEDIAHKIGLSADAQVKICTIHKFGYDLVRDNWELVRRLWGSEHWPSEAKLATKEDELELLANWFRSSNITGFQVQTFYNDMEKMRAFGLSPNTFRGLLKSGVYFGRFSDRMVEIWDGYEAYRLSAGLLLFADMINLARSLMTHPEVSSRIRSRYAHLLLDEAQDTSSDQWDLLRPLISECRTTLIVYDVNQAIYGWRGGDTGPLRSLGFIHDAVCFSLTKSFRSGKNIADAANVIVPNKQSQIQTDKEGGEVKLHGFRTMESEADFVLSQATEASAIISRTNAYLELVERKCILAGRPYTGNSFYRSNHIRKLAESLQEFKTDNWQKHIRQAFIDNTVYTSQERGDFQEALRIIKNESAETFLSIWQRAQTLENMGLTLTTGHASKGLEWDQVFVIGVHHGHVPHHMSQDELEEQNLFYVMVTRPRDVLYLTWVGKPSVFIPHDWLEYANFQR